MIGYYVRLAFNSFRRTPGLTLLMVCALALGISSCIVILTVYEASSGDPIRWKSAQLFAVTMDSWDPNEAADPKRPDLPPTQLAYKDAKFVLPCATGCRRTARISRLCRPAVSAADRDVWDRRPRSDPRSPW